MEEALVKEIVKKVMERIKDDQTIPVEVSARHVHLSKENIEKLFGKDYKMTMKKELSQPGQYQYNERVSLIGPKGMIKNVAILGPPRDETQIEVSLTDAKTLGIELPVRESGQLEKSASLFIASEKAVIEANESVIAAKRHIHMTPEDAERLKVYDKQSVAVKVKGERPIIFEDVLVRVNRSYRLSMHIDFDEANAAGFKNGIAEGIIYRGEEYSTTVNENFNNISRECEIEPIRHDIKTLRKKDIYKYLQEILNLEKKEPLFLTCNENIRDEKATMDNRVIIESDIRKACLNGYKTLQVGKHSIITPLALDYIRSNKINLIRK